jgi:uncharacterized protein (TIRG00374 family)
VKRTSRRLLLGVIAGVLVFAGFSLYADAGKLGDRLAEFSWAAMGAALGLAVLNYALRFVRWTLYLRRRELDVPTGISALVFLSGFALSVTPGKVGELIKSFLLRETRGIPVTQTAPIVVAERVTDLLALLLVGAVGVAVYGIAQTTVIVGIALLVFGMLVLTWPRLAKGVIRLFTTPHFARKWRARLGFFYDELKALVLPGPLSWATALAMLAWLAECVGFAIIIAGFSGTDVPWLLAISIYAATTVAGALSFLPGGLLVTEAGMTLLLVQASRGVDEPTAVAATILTRLATLWFAVVLGIAALTLLRKLAPASERALQDDPPEKADSQAQPPVDGEGA